jgi:hypothetical protein
MIGMGGRGGGVIKLFLVLEVLGAMRTVVPFCVWQYCDGAEMLATECGTFEMHVGSYATGSMKNNILMELCPFLTVTRIISGSLAICMVIFILTFHT